MSLYNESTILRSTAGGYSADVRLRLRLNGELIPLAQIGPDRIILREPLDLPVGPGEIVMHVDGHERRWAIEIVQRAGSSCIVPIKLTR